MSRIGNVFIIGFIASALFTMTVLPAVAANDFDKPVDYAPIHVENLKPEIVPIERLQEGLSVTYYLDYYERNLDGISRSGGYQYKQVKGKPIPELNHQFGKKEVFDSDTNRGVAMRMTGYLYIAETGDYEFQALSNDGVRVVLAGQTIISDPEQHSDRLSNIGYATVEQTGYYPLIVEYFQRKGTAALKLFWKIPQADDFVTIPQNAYVNLP